MAREHSMAWVSFRIAVRREINQKTRLAVCHKEQGYKIGTYIEEDLSVMSKKIFVPVGNLHFQQKVTLGKNIDLLWEMSYTFHESTVPSWSGFMQTFRKGEYPGKSEVNLPTIINP